LAQDDNERFSPVKLYYNQEIVKVMSATVKDQKNQQQRIENVRKSRVKYVGLTERTTEYINAYRDQESQLLVTLEHLARKCDKMDRAFSKMNCAIEVHEVSIFDKERVFTASHITVDGQPQELVHVLELERMKVETFLHKKRNCQISKTKSHGYVHFLKNEIIIT
jgi:F0F1-type ATP synthase gamma subunit